MMGTLDNGAFSHLRGKVQEQTIHAYISFVGDDRLSVSDSVWVAFWEE